MRNKTHAVILFWAAVLFYVVYQLTMQPGFVLSGEMWAEMATNYFINASAPSLLDKLFSTDAGYIPVPQRIIGLVVNQLNIPAASVPYVYTGTAIIFTGMLIGSFCLPAFRKVIRSDGLRFLVAITVLMVADFETRTYINFTYFSAFFIAIVTALALVDDTEEVPWWSWFIPVLIISKPAVLSAFPAMLLVALVSRSRFRWITVVAVVFCLGQIFQMSLSATAGTMPFRSNDITLFSKVIAAVEYFFGFLGGYILHSSHLPNHPLMLVGLLFLILSAMAIMFWRGKARALILVGLALLFFNVFLNAFALSDMWNRDMSRLQGLPVYRHIIVGFFGCVLVVAGLLAEVSERLSGNGRNRYLRHAAPVLFLVWFMATGWLISAGQISREPGSPALNNSQWQKMAEAIDSPTSPLCVPVDPVGWMYQRNCNFLKPAPTWANGTRVLTSSLSLEETPPAALSGKNLVAAAVMVRPFSSGKNTAEVRMTIKLVDGSSRYFSGSKTLKPSGGLILLTGRDVIAMKDIASVTLEFSAPVEVALSAEGSGVVWMGF
ncbi:hypothetical protein [Erwinia psidii]|uniref:hypothetical protein n=1 Tax=Erwinia psidii TaxID=69224 RepID=UPI000F52040C|nr:hypothetical protein [Erwinia psidii]MCX8956437.1 hypothetical protein [Erwinia psidii]MCX8962283.1 hypothetical protein [Erwinia psidii]